MKHKMLALIGCMAALLIFPTLSFAKDKCKKSKHVGKMKCVGKDVYECQGTKKKNRKWVKLRTCSVGCRLSGSISRPKAVCTCVGNQNHNGLYCSGKSLMKCHNSSTSTKGTAKVHVRCHHGCYKAGSSVLCSCVGNRKKGERWCSNGKQYICQGLSVKASGDPYNLGKCP